VWGRRRAALVARPTGLNLRGANCRYVNADRRVLAAPISLQPGSDRRQSRTCCRDIEDSGTDRRTGGAGMRLNPVLLFAKSVSPVPISGRDCRHVRSPNATSRKRRSLLASPSPRFRFGRPSGDRGTPGPEKRRSRFGLDYRAWGGAWLTQSSGHPGRPRGDPRRYQDQCAAVDLSARGGRRAGVGADTPTVRDRQAPAARAEIIASDELSTEANGHPSSRDTVRGVPLGFPL
jgi:hypothetical protein